MEERERRNIESIAHGRISLKAICDELKSNSIPEIKSFCRRLYGRIPVGDVAISETYDKEGHEIIVSGLTLQQENESDNLTNAIGYIECHFGFDTWNDEAEQPKAKSIEELSKSSEFPYLPYEINTKRARTYFIKAEQRGWITITENGYEWHDYNRENGRGAKARLAYMLQKIYCPKMTEEFPETQLNRLFGEKRLGETCRKLNLNKKNAPRHYEEIDDLFDD